MSKLDLKKAIKQEEAYLRLVHPTPDDIPGCISIFDTYLSCSVIRSQIKSLYRYGERPECASKLEDFKFCLTLKSMHPEEQYEAFIRRRAEWWAGRRLNKSSEDVWDIREEPLKQFPIPITDEQLGRTSLE
ncbi:uncharacterized protein LACBIDRAFT_190194 [Laccaria bicolor S238N-H82]|uniref:Predicted protein n=1 Tax=Laccaria bicolor (strain S238N-H82 / ATCC MYA-4686) TaxID=486041 RepID=B0D8H2_LACBS|nr:uncharacterized protein LACBIDRAFT_190194 [Laccaria bicolor S238N-H82]EDR09078.1 predicted protein [Laccaria bicolor S238N-H82]|eukprot:XP_001880391.1 predicted protein [Laccaria bicolor S238N-H82]